MVEKYWAFFMGFGTPIVILLRCCSFAVGYSIYLAVLPILVIVVSLADYSALYKSLGHQPTLPLFVLVRLGVGVGSGSIKSRPNTHKSAPDTDLSAEVADMDAHVQSFSSTV